MRSLHVKNEVGVAEVEVLARQNLLTPATDKPAASIGVDDLAIRRHHDALLRKAGVPRYLMHEARHTVVVQRSKYETMHGVSRMVGHASAAYTVDQYWHAQTGHDRSSAQALADELRRRRES